MNGIIEQVMKGGLVMIPLLILSTIAIAVFIEKLIVLRRRKVLAPAIVNVIETVKTKEDLPLAISICDQNQGAFSNIIKIVLHNPEATQSEVKEELNDRGRQEIRSLERGLGFLEIVATVSPILGLLGTVMGMIKVFKTIALEGVGEASALSGGISEALISTAAGLTVAIPVLFIYHFLANRVEGYMLDIEEQTNRLLKTMKKIKAK